MPVRSPDLRRSLPVAILGALAALLIWRMAPAEPSSPTAAAPPAAADSPNKDSSAKSRSTGEDTGEKGEDIANDHRIPKGGPYKLPGERGTFLRTPYVQCSTPDSIYVVWRTLKRLEAPAVRVGGAPGSLIRRVEGPSVVLRRLSEEGDPGNPIYSAPAGTHQYEAQITGLQPDSRYFYGVFDGDTQLSAADDSYYFRTLPAPGTSRELLFWIVGDSGTGQRQPKAVHRAMIDWLRQNNRELDLYTHVGDMAYNDGKDIQLTDNFFKIYDETLRHTVCFPAFGNHEGRSSNGNSQLGPYFDAYICPTRGEAGGEASGTESYYSFDFGRAHFIVLNSHDADRRAHASMARWLKNDLDKVRPGATDWILAYFHHPPYTKGSHDSDREVQLREMRQFIVPILESGGVDLVFTGHSHIYERSMLIDGAYATPTTAQKDPVSGKFPVLDDGDGHPDRDGAYRKSAGLNDHQGSIHIVAGHGGTKNSAKFGGASPVMKKVTLDHGSVLIEIKDSTLTGTMLTYQGHIFDTFQMVKAGRILAQRVENPRILTHTLAGTRVPEPVPADAQPLIGPRAEWRYLAGSDPEGTTWTAAEYDDRSWRKGRAGFGYNYPELGTELADMRDHYRRLYLRTEFALENVDDAEKIGLAINFDDAFIAYLNGEEVLRQNVSGRGKDVTDVTRIDKGVRQFYSLEPSRARFRIGRNVLAIEGHNDSRNSSDFALEPCLLRKK